jgi:N utilization substance protein B
LDVLYSADLRGLSPATVLADTVRRMAGEGGVPPYMEYTTELVEEYVRHASRVNEVIVTYAEGWTLERMPAVDRNLIRIAVTELLYRADVDHPVAMSEAVALAAELSTDDSPRFVNGLLGRVERYATG